MAKKTVLVRAVACGLMLSACAADWTDANNNQYTALKSIKGNGSGSTGGPRIVTDILPAGTDTVKLKFTPATLSGNECLFCTRNSKTGSSVQTDAFSGFRTSNKIRIDRYHTARYTTCTTTVLTVNNDYALVADFNKGNVVGSAEDSAVSINGIYQALSPGGRTDGKLGNVNYTPAGPLMLFASHFAGSELSESSAYDNSSSCYLYYFQLYSSNGTLKHNLMPARNANGVAGLYDTVGRKFYGPVGPSGHDTFTAAARTVTGTGVKWTGLGGDNKMSTGANWEGGVAPAAGQDLDFTLAVPLVEINADIPGVTFGKMWLDDGDIPTFTGSMTISAVNLPLKIAGNPAITMTAGDYTWNGGSAANWGAAGVWTYGGAAATWADDNNAIFSTADATATLAADVTANALAFTAPATIDGANVLTVPSVSVAPGVVAVIAAPTAGTLDKTGAGTLVLSQSRTADTAVSEGTLELAGSASLDGMRLTLGKDADKPVTLRIGPNATLANLPLTTDSWNLGTVANVTSTVYKVGGDLTCWNFVLGRASDAVITFHNAGGELMAASKFYIGHDGAALSTVTVSGGTVGSSTTASQSVIVGYTSEGVLTVTNTGVFAASKSLFVANKANGTINVSDGGTVRAADGDLVYCWQGLAGRGVVNLGRGGVLEANRAYLYTAGGSATFNFDGGTYRRASTSGDLFAANGSSAAIDVSVGANGGTIDNNGFDVTIPRTMTGTGGLTLIGAGKTTFSADQSYAGTTTVSNGTTLSVAGVSFAGPLALEAGTTLDIASSGAGGVTAVSAPTLTFPAADGAVMLTLAGGAFAEGAYPICSTPGMTTALSAKFAFATAGNLPSSWSVVGNTLVLTVGNVAGNVWTGAANDRRMSTDGNWYDGSAPANGEVVDFSGISAPATIIADIDNATFGAVTMGTGVITFTGALVATSFSDTSKVAVGENATVTLDNDLEFYGTNTKGNLYVVYTVGAGGTFAVTGDIIAKTGNKSIVWPCSTISNAGTIRARGLVNNSGANDKFALARASANASANWAIGDHGISGAARFYIGDASGVNAHVRAESDFTLSAGLVIFRPLTLNTTGLDGTPHTITLGTNTLHASGGLFGANTNGMATVAGTGRVVANYDVDNLTTYATSLTNPFVVTNTATLALMQGADLGTSPITVCDGATLELAESGTVTLNGGLVLNDGARLAFNFTDRGTTPVLAIADGKELAFAEGATKNIAVKVSGAVHPAAGEKVLTACGGFDAEGVTVSLAADAPDWAKRLSVNGDGNLVLEVTPTGTFIIVR